jgi:hypothetical protein
MATNSHETVGADVPNCRRQLVVSLGTAVLWNRYVQLVSAALAARSWDERNESLRQLSELLDGADGRRQAHEAYLRSMMAAARSKGASELDEAVASQQRRFPEGHFINGTPLCFRVEGCCSSKADEDRVLAVLITGALRREARRLTTDPPT